MSITRLIPRSMGERIGIQYRGLMPRSIPNRGLWRLSIVLLIAIVLAFCSIALARAGDGIKGHQVESAKPLYEVAGAPASAIVITSCNLIVVVYMTMPSGELIRFDKSDNIESKVLLAAAETAKVRERVEVGCDVQGAPRYDRRPKDQVKLQPVPPRANGGWM